MKNDYEMQEMVSIFGKKRNNYVFEVIKTKKNMEDVGKSRKKL